MEKKEKITAVRTDPILQKKFSWSKAYGISALIHIIIVAILFAFLYTAVKHHDKEVYVIDMDLAEKVMGSEGGSGGSKVSFPKALSQSAVDNKMKEVKQTATAPQTAATNPNADSVNVPSSGAPSSSQNGQSDGQGSGNGSGEGSGEGNGRGHGSGDGTGHGNGNAPGSGNSNEGKQVPFDTGGFNSAAQAYVNANMGNQVQIVRRHLSGTVVLTAHLDGSGNCVGVDVNSGPSGLVGFAKKSVYAVCPYPNPTGAPISVVIRLTINAE